MKNYVPKTWFISTVVVLAAIGGTILYMNHQKKKQLAQNAEIKYPTA